jgi:hypothetical protein
MVMMKHLQEPVPSVVEERHDIPAAVGRVVSRAMAKVPDNRYQTVSEFLEDLTIAAGMTIKLPVAVPPVTVGPPLVSDEDEVTVVRPREEAVYAPRPQIHVPVAAAVAPVAVPKAANFNPLKILIPSAVALLVVFAVIYAVTRESETSNSNNNTNQTQTLAADPNSQPAIAASPATGKNEQGIPSGGTINPESNANTNVNANAAVQPSPLENINENANANVNENANANANSNRKAPSVSTPSRTVSPEDEPPPPVPSPTKPPAPKPSPSAVQPAATP